MVRNKLLCLMPIMALMVVLVGCGGKKVMVVRKPQWNYKAYERLAVAPIGTTVPAASDEAAQITTMLTDLLVQNGEFTIVSREDLAAILKEQDIALTDLADPSTALPTGMIQVAQALVTARITEFSTDSRREQTTIVVPTSSKPYFRQQTVMKYTNEARIAGSVRVVDAATGEVIFAHPTPPLVAEDSRIGQPPETSTHQLASQAARELAMELYAQLAPVRRQAKLDEDMLFVATAPMYDGKYERAKRVPTSLDQVLIVVQGMPKECDRNSFRAALTVKDGRQDLFSEEFVWSGTFGAAGKVFAVPISTLTETGAQEFTAKLYVAGDPAPALTRDFELQSPSQ